MTPTTYIESAGLLFRGRAPQEADDCTGDAAGYGDWAGYDLHAHDGGDDGPAGRACGSPAQNAGDRTFDPNLGSPLSMGVLTYVKHRLRQMAHCRG